MFRIAMCASNASALSLQMSVPIKSAYRKVRTRIRIAELHDLFK